MRTIKEIILNGSNEERLALFNFDSSYSNEEVVTKFNLWARYSFPKFFKNKDAYFHKQIDHYNLEAYRGDIKSFTDIVFREGGKTSRTKLFFAYVIANDTERSRKYFKILSKDLANAKQSVTDIYNMLISRKVIELYPEIFQKTASKREETMSSFTTATGIKLRAGTVGTDQRGQLQDEARPDIIWFDDFETRKSLRSAVETQALWDNMEEAKTGLSQHGACIYTCNYISERGNVHKLVEKENDRNIVLIVPIIDEEGVPTWDRYTVGYIKQLKEDVDDFAGEYLCKPSAGGDILFDRPTLDKMPVKNPMMILADFKIYQMFDPSSRYASGHDIAGGVQLDSSTSVFIEFDTVPARVVATYKNNKIKPDIFGNEIKRQADYFGTCLVAPEKNNHGHATIAILKQIYPTDKIHETQGKDTKQGETKPTEFGWHTNKLTKPKMLYDLKKAVEKGLLVLNDKDLIAEARAYTRDDLMDEEIDPRLATRHFDLLIACFVKGTLILTDKGQRPIETLEVGDRVMTRDGYKRIKSKSSRLKKVITNIGLTGTSNHPIILANNSIKELSSVDKADTLHIWNHKKQQIEKLSYTEARNIIDTQTQREDNIESITMVGQNGKSQQLHYIDKYGLIALEQFQKITKSITKTATQIITTLKTLKCYLQVSICEDICQTQEEKNNYEKHSNKIERKLIKEYQSIIKIRNLLRSYVNYVVRLVRERLIMQSFVPENAQLGCNQLKEENLKFGETVEFATKNFKQVFQIKNDVQRDVKNYAEGSTYQRVYNLEIEDTPEYFANNILVHNCAIAWQMKDFALPADFKNETTIQSEQTKETIYDAI